MDPDHVNNNTIPLTTSSTKSNCKCANKTETCDDLVDQIDEEMGNLSPIREERMSRGSELSSTSSCSCNVATSTRFETFRQERSDAPSLGITFNNNNNSISSNLIGSSNLEKKEETESGMSHLNKFNLHLNLENDNHTRHAHTHHLHSLFHGNNLPSQSQADQQAETVDNNTEENSLSIQTTSLGNRHSRSKTISGSKAIEKSAPATAAAAFFSSFNSSLVGNNSLPTSAHKSTGNSSTSHGRSNSFTGPYGPMSSASGSNYAPSPAMSFLSQFMDSSGTGGGNNSATKEQEELENGDIVGKYVIGKIIGHGSFSLVRECWTMGSEDIAGLKSALPEEGEIKGDDDDGSSNNNSNKNSNSTSLLHVSSSELVNNNDDAFSSIKTVRNRLAAKIIKSFGNNEQESAFKSFENEISIWKNLNHPHILPLIDVIDTPTHKIAFCPLAVRGTLFQKILREGAIPEERAKNLFKQLASALYYLHEEVCVVHRDIKLENCLLDSSKRSMDDHLYLTDFGLSDTFSKGAGSFSNSSNSSSFNGGVGNNNGSVNFSGNVVRSEEDFIGQTPLSPGTPRLISYPFPNPEDSARQAVNTKFAAGSVAYCAPEELATSSDSDLLIKSPEMPTPKTPSEAKEEAAPSSSPILMHHLPQSDVWSAGVVLYAIVTGNLPFSDEFIPRLQYRIRKAEYPSLPEHLSSDLTDLVSKMLTRDWRKRISIGEVIEHPWLKG